MNIAQAYTSGDRAQSIRWQEQIKKWGGLGRHRLFLLRAFDCEPIPEILPFTEVLDVMKLKSSWSASNGNVTDCASGPDSMFRMFARYFEMNHLGAWFNCEPDCIPLFPDSLDRWEAEYLACGKPFMGGFVSFPAPHITGCSHYPEDTPLYSDLILPHRSTDRTREISFDVAGGRQTVPLAHLTTSMQHVWRAPAFTSQADFDARVDKRALFYHSNKDGSIYQFLESNRKEGDATCAATAEPVPTATATKNGATSTPDHPTQRSNGAVKFEPETAPTVHSETSSPTDRAAKARAALAAKRATGWKPGPYKKRKKRRRAKAKATSA